MGKELCRSIVTLILKNNVHKNILQFQPISLLLVVFKMLMKVIINCLKSHMSDLGVET